MKRWVFGAVSVALLASQAAVAQSTRASIQGVWRIVEATTTGPGARTIPFAERPNLTIITARHYSRVEVQADKPRPILADVTKATADELRAAWGPFVSEAGTYELTPGSFITMRPIASKNPAVMGPGVFITYAYKLEGDSLSLTQARNQSGPFAKPFTLKLTRVIRISQSGDCRLRTRRSTVVRGMNATSDAITRLRVPVTTTRRFACQAS